MNILDFSRDQVVAFSEKGMMNKKSVLHYDVCLDIKKGTPYAKIADKYNMSEVRLVSYIKEKKCPDCK